MSSVRRRTAFAALLLCACAPSGCAPGREKPRHVVLIVVDTLRADHLSTYGYPRPTSPELDKLAREGAVFERAISQGSWTVPSMVSMLTGAYLADEVMTVPADKTTLAQSFQKAGYATAAYIYNNVLNVERGFHSGFDVFDFEDPPYGPVDEIAAWFAANKGKRTFTFIHLNEAHDPYGQAAEFDRFVRELDALSPERMEYFRKLSSELGLRRFDENVRKINEHIGGYDDDVRYSDDHIGKILAAIRATGEWDRTAIAIAADHGEGLFTHVQYMESSRLQAQKRGELPTLFNTLQMTHGSKVDFPLLHVPVILVAPGMPKGVRVEPWVENVDISATLLELCDLPRPEGLQGTSLVPLWRQPHVVAHQKRGVFSSTRYVQSFIDQDGYQLIRPTPRGECEFGLQTELYHLRLDPEARVNLAAREKKRVESLAKQIEERHKIGMAASSAIVSDAPDLKAIGYVDDGTVDKIDQANAAKSVAELIAELGDPREANANCLVRLRLAIALSQRTLTPEEKAKLREVQGREISEAVRRIEDEILAR